MEGEGEGRGGEGGEEREAEKGERTRDKEGRKPCEGRRRWGICRDLEAHNISKDSPCYRTLEPLPVGTCVRMLGLVETLSVSPLRRRRPGRESSLMKL